MASPEASGRDVFLLLGFVAGKKNMVRAQRSVRRDDDADRAVHAREFFDGGDVFDVAHAGAAVLGRKDNAQQAEFAEFLDRRQREFAGFVPLHDVGSDFALGKFAHTFLQLKLFVVELEIHETVSVSRAAAPQNNWIRTQQFQRDKVTTGKCGADTLVRRR